MCFPPPPQPDTTGDGLDIDVRNVDVSNVDVCNIDVCNVAVCNVDVCNVDVYNVDVYNVDVCNIDDCNFDVCNIDVCNVDVSLKTDLRFARPKIRESTERAKRRSDENVVKTLWNPTAWWSE